MPINQRRFVSPKRVMPGVKLPDKSERASDTRSYQVDREQISLIEGLVLDDLADVAISVPLEGHTLRYDDGEEEWVNSFLALDDLSDVAITAAATGDILRYNGANWVDSTAYITTDPPNSTWNTIQPTGGDFECLILKSQSGGAGVAGLFQCYNPSDERVMLIGPDGQTSLTFRDAGTNNVPAAFRLQHSTSGTAAVGFGTQQQVFLENASGSTPEAANIQWFWANATGGSEECDVSFRTLTKGTNAERLRIAGNGTAGLTTRGTPNASNVLFNLTKSTLTAVPEIRTYLQVLGIEESGLTASTEASEVVFNFGVTKTFATGALASQRSFRILAPTLAFAGASTVTDATTVYIDNAPVAGANATLTNRYSIWADAGMARFDGDGTYVFELPADTAAGGAYKGRIPVLIGGTLQYLQYFDP